MHIYTKMETEQGTVKPTEEMNVEDTIKPTPEDISQVSNDLPSSASEEINNKEDKKPFKPKEKRLYEEIEIPDGIIVNVTRTDISMKKDDKEIVRKIVPLVNVKTEGNKVQISADRMRKSERKLFGTMKAHIKNMIKGLTEGFIYKLQIANVHFPMAVSHDKENNEFVVKNFLGEKKDRRIKLVKDVDVKIDKEVIELTSYDIEKAGQVATNIEKGTRVRNKDRRVYQDGIFIIEKPRRVYL